MSEAIEEVIDEVKQGEVVVGEPSEIEEKALKMGWTPLDKFKGDPAKWRTADEFVERGENMLPIVKARVAQQATEIQELKAAMKQFGEYHTKTEQRAYDRALNDLREQRAQAIAAGDGATFDKVDEQIESLRKEVEEKNRFTETQQNTENDPVYVEWLGRNKWATDPAMEKWAYAHGKYLIEIGEAELGLDVFEKISKAAKIKYPEKFENQRRMSAPSVEGGVPSARRGGKSYADLPADAKAACERMAKNAYIGDEKQAAKFKAEYVKNYFEEA
jgi:hypothetical protein